MGFRRGKALAENNGNSLRRLCAPVALQANAPLLVFMRVQLVTGLIAGLSLVLLPAVFLAALFLHNRRLGTAGIFILAINLMSYGAREAFRTWLALRIGRWTGWKREPIGRHELPVHFWVWTAIHAALAAIYAGVAVFLGLVGFGLAMKR